MFIKKMRVTNFRSFRDFEIELNHFNVVIGANASGKSNFIAVFKFLKDIANNGLDNAISMQGGSEYFKNIHLGSSAPFSIEMEMVIEEPLGVILSISPEGDILATLETDELVYRFSIEFMKKGGNFKVVEDKLILRGAIVEFRREEKLDRGALTIIHSGGRFDALLSLSGESQQHNLPFLENSPKVITTKSLILKGADPRSPRFMFPSLDRMLGRISIFDFDPKSPKRAIPISGKNELEADGSNIAIVLKNILGDTKEKQSFIHLIKDILPFVDDVTVERFADTSLLFNIREVYAPRNYLPASLMSDGTVNITLLIIALYFDKSPLVIIEEPERNVHPSLLSRVANLLSEASKQKQIIVTTHNPHIIKYINVEDLLLITRDAKGFSTVCRPIDQAHVRGFLQNDIGIDDLFIQDLLSV